MSIIVVDIESDGPIPGDYSMIAFGAVIVNEKLDQSFEAKLKPISKKWRPEALAISGFTRQETLTFDDPYLVMHQFQEWINHHNHGRPLFFSDNNGFDWQFINWYFHHFVKNNPFGHSSTNIGSVYKGLVGDMSKNFKHLRKTKHTHNPLDDAIGNAEALLHMKARMNFKIDFNEV